MLAEIERDPLDTGEPILVCCVACEQQVDVMFAHYDRACEVWICHECLVHCGECELFEANDPILEYDDEDEELAAEPAS